MTRAHVLKATQDDVLIHSARRCALCFGLHGTLTWERYGQIAHVDGDNTNAAYENLAFLCMPHHVDYDGKTRQTKGWLPGELLHYRAQLYAAIAAGQHHKGDPVVFDRVTLPEITLEHDRRMFRAGDAIFCEADLAALLQRLGNDHSYDSAQTSPIEAFCEHFAMESNKYLIAELQGPTNLLTTFLATLDGFLARHFFTHRGRLCLYPDLNVDRGGIPDAEGDATYAKYAGELHHLLDEVEKVWRDYRRTVKQTLHI